MKTSFAGFDLAIWFAVALLAVVLPYLAYRVYRGIRVYLAYRGARIVTCPETQIAEVVEVAASSMALQAMVDEPCMRLSKCSRWPMRRDCGQDCSRQLEARPPEVRFCFAIRP